MRRGDNPVGQGGRRWSTVGVAVVLLLLGVVVWAVALFAVGRSTEDLCLDDLSRTGYQSYRAGGEIFPPRLECELRNPTHVGLPEQVTVGHPWWAAAWLMAGAGVPVGWLVGTMVVVRRRWT